MACCIVSVSVAETFSPDEPPSAHKGVFFPHGGTFCVLPSKILPPVSILREQEFVDRIFVVNGNFRYTNTRNIENSSLESGSTMVVEFVCCCAFCAISSGRRHSSYVDEYERYVDKYERITLR